MGDRRNIIINCNEWEDKKIYLYTHWDGSRLPTILQIALNKKERWDDPSYLTRIIFDTMLAVGEAYGGETGYGISPVIGDGSNKDIFIDIDKQTVTISDDMFSFKEFITIDLDKINEFDSYDEEDDY